jgi:GNAT superfamily N-acetyltransferase
MQYTARKATLADLGTIVRHRYLMFAEIGHGDPAVMEAGKAQYTEWLRERLLNGRYQGWLMECGSGEVVAGVGLWLLEWPGGVVDLVPFRGYVFNVWTEPVHRRNGLSRQLMGMLLEASREQGILRVYLHASDAGRKLYELLGFSPSNEMMIRLPALAARAPH